METTRPPTLPPDWPAVLEKVLRALEQTAQQTAERERLYAEPLPPIKRAAPSLDDRIARLREAADMAAHMALEADEALAEVETTLRDWLARATANQRKLDAPTTA